MEKPHTVYSCGNPECSNAIDTEGMNRIQIKALGYWPKTCDICKHRTLWQQQIALFSPEFKKVNGGVSRNAKSNYPRTH